MIRIGLRCEDNLMKKFVLGEWEIEYDEEAKRYAILRKEKWICSYGSLRGALVFLSSYLGIPYNELKKNVIEK